MSEKLEIRDIYEYKTTLYSADKDGHIQIEMYTDYRFFSVEQTKQLIEFLTEQIKDK